MNGPQDEFPSIESHLPEMMRFIASLVQDYQAGKINAWPVMEERVHTFFTPAMLDKLEGVAPGWGRMGSYAEGITLVHVMIVFMALWLCPEFRQASPTQQALLKWAVLFHDIAKEVHTGQRDLTHGFRSAAITGAALPGLDFAPTPAYNDLIEDWLKLVNTAIKPVEGSVYIQDNDRLPEILAGIERLFGRNTPAALIVEIVLFHMSISVVQAWPQAAPLTEAEVKQYLEAELLPLLRVMMLVDNEGWALFEPPISKQYRQETLAVFEKLARLNSWS